MNCPAVIEHIQHAIGNHRRQADRLLEINEALMGRGPVPMARSLAEDSIQVSAAPVQPGMISSGVSITVKYEMVSADPGQGS